MTDYNAEPAGEKSPDVSPGNHKGTAVKKNGRNTRTREIRLPSVNHDLRFKVDEGATDTACKLIPFLSPKGGSGKTVLATPVLWLQYPAYRRRLYHQESDKPDILGQEGEHRESYVLLQGPSRNRRRQSRRLAQRCLRRYAHPSLLIRPATARESTSFPTTTRRSSSQASATAFS